jgi:hypothetical protein
MAIPAAQRTEPAMSPRTANPAAPSRTGTSDQIAKGSAYSRCRQRTPARAGTSNHGSRRVTCRPSQTSPDLPRQLPRSPPAKIERKQTLPTSMKRHPTRRAATSPRATSFCRLRIGNSGADGRGVEAAKPGPCRGRDRSRAAAERSATVGAATNASNQMRSTLRDGHQNLGSSAQYGPR